MNAMEDLISAIESLDADTVEQLLKSDLEIEYGNGAHNSVLFIAIELITGETAFFVCQTALHLVIQCCNCRRFSSDDYKDLVKATIELLLKNNANINAKTNFGETPLMKASELGCRHIVQLLLDWRDELGAGLDLNARDIFGETALIKAAKSAHVDVIELLLQHGGLDKFQDHRGFYALHAVVCGSDLSDNVSNDFLQSIGIDASEQSVEILDRYGANEFLRRTISKNWHRNKDIQKIVSMLVTTGRSDINSLDFRDNTVLDLAFKSKVRISQETIDMLVKLGAPISSYMNKDSANLGNPSQIVDKLGKTAFHRLCAAEPEVFLSLEVLDSANLLKSSPFKELIEAMAVRKDHRGRTALHYAVMTRKMIYSHEDFLMTAEEKFLLSTTLFKLAHITNERDNYGRIPLHYCQDENFYYSLVEHGADKHIKDIDGQTPQDFRQLREEEHFRHNLPSEVTIVLSQLDVDECEDDESKDDEFKDDECNKKVYKDGAYKKSTNDRCILADQSIPMKVDTWKIWKGLTYASCDQFSKIMRDRVQQLMNRLSDEIRKKDPRFECRPALIGSAEEETKIGLPDEFDFNFILTKLSEICEVVPSPEAPNGFIHLKRKLCTTENQLSSQGFQSQEDFDTLFNSNGFLLTTEIASRFRILYLQVMSEPEFWDEEDVFEWDTSNEIGLIYLRRKQGYNESEISHDFRPSTHLCSSIRLKLNRPIEGRYMFTLTSVDMVPCIKINGWWPEKALSSVNDEAKLDGCHLVFDQPQIKYPRVPFSDPYARISFAPAESRIIKMCSVVAKAAYMVGKMLLCYYDTSKLTYVLKTCLLYCIEALNNSSRNILLYEDIDPCELRFFVENLMLCFHEFYQKDFVPCYLMPSFHLPIEGYLKSKHDELLNNSSYRYPMFAYKLYSVVCTAESPIDYCPTATESLNEKFNKEDLMRKLSMNRISYIDNRPVSPECFEISRWQVCPSESKKRRMEMNADETKVKRQC